MEINVLEPLPNFQLLQEVVNVINEGLIVKDLDGKILTFNRQALELLELPVSRLANAYCKDLAGIFCRTDGSVYKWEEMPTVVTMHTGVPNKDVIVGLAHVPVTKWLSVSSKIITVEGRRLVLITFFDVTALQEANRKLAEKEQHMNLIVSSVDDLLFEILQDGTILNFWTNNEDLLFFRPEEFLGKKLNSLFPEELVNMFMEVITDALNGRKDRVIEYMSPVPSHAEKWYRLKVYPIHTFTDKVAAVVSDITEEVKAREKIRISEQTFHNAFHYSAVGMALVDLEGRCADVNNTLSEILGYTAEELRVMPFHQFTHPDDLKLDLEHLRRLLNKEQESYTMEKRYLHKKGHYIWCLLAVSLVWNSNDQPGFFIAQVQDITHIKNMIRELEQQNARLELTTLDLEHKISQLEEFNQIVAHNLRSPAGNIQMLLSEMQYAASGDQGEYFQLLKQSSDTLMETLQELIDILEVRLQKKLPFESCHFETLTQKVLRQLNTEVFEKSAIIETDFAVPVLNYPKVYLESILYNLISNALKYAHPHRNPRIILHTYEQHGVVCLSVSDNGLGIDLEKYGKHMFKYRKIFHPGHDSKGVGLFMTRNQIETLGGSIRVESEPVIGTTFIVRFQ
ncbi:PAS domain S-box protein [Chitinophagaceae bacterium MMS25-I14]